MTTRTWVGGIALAALALLGLAIAGYSPDAASKAGVANDPGWLLGEAHGGWGGGGVIWQERGVFVAWVVVLACAPAVPPRLLWTVTGFLLAAFAVAPPLLSLDVFSYLSYARLDALHGLNPYEAVPESVSGDDALRFLRDNRDVVSAYGPLFTLLSLPLAHLGTVAGVYVLKTATALSVLATAWIAGRLATSRGLDPRPAVVLIALNPLVLVHVVGGGHNDALAALVLALGVAGVLTAREASGAVGLVAAAGVKLSAGFALPFVAVAGLLRDRRLLVGLAAGLVAVLALSLAFFGSGLSAILDVADHNQERGTSGSFPRTIAADLGADPGTVADVFLGLYAVAVAGLLIWVARGGDWVRAAAWAGVGLLIASSYVPPWYAILPLPLVAIARDRALVVVAVLVSGYLLRYQVPGLGG